MGRRGEGTAQGWEGPSRIPGFHPNSEASQTLPALEGHVHPEAAPSAGWEKSVSRRPRVAPPDPVPGVLGVGGQQ